MRQIKIIAAAVVVAALAGCAGLTGANDSDAVVPLTGNETDYNVVDVDVIVSRDLSVSEANLYYPVADIVWREDPQGDRYAQVQDILETAMTRGASLFQGTRDVNVTVDLKRFHAISQKARYTVGGVHGVNFELTVTDSETGEVLQGPRLVSAELHAYGGTQAIEAEGKGLTQKVRITQHLAGVLQRELTTGARVSVDGES